MTCPVAKLVKAGAVIVDLFKNALCSGTAIKSSARLKKALPPPMRKSALVAQMRASAAGTISRSASEGDATRMLSGKPSHCSTLKTVRRFKKGIAFGSSPPSEARVCSSLGMKRSA